MSRFNSPYPTRELEKLKDKLRSLKNAIQTALNNFEKDLDDLEKEYVEFQDTNQDLRVEIQVQANMITSLQEELVNLKKDKRELLSEFAETIDRLKRKRRSLEESPESPGKSPSPQPGHSWD